jgi:hypothetical protein
MVARVQREIGDGWQLALALDGLARSRAALALDEDSEEEAARGHWAEALRALEPFTDARAAGLRGRICAELD